jgi:hypothetical protein
VLADVLADKIVLGAAVEGCRQVGDGVSKAWSLQGDVRFCSSPSKVDDPGFIVQTPRNDIGTAVVLDQSKSPAPSSQATAPPVSTMSRLSGS